MKTAITKSPKQMIALLEKRLKFIMTKWKIFFKCNRRAQEKTFYRINYSLRKTNYSWQQAKESKFRYKLFNINCTKTSAIFL